MVKHCVEGCTGHCCMFYSVFVTDNDVKRMMKETKLHPKRFLELHSPSAERQGFYPKVCVSSEWKVLGLKHNKYELSCYFFMKNAGMCGVNKSKPLVCRTYPFSTDKEEQLMHMNGTLCPVKWMPENKKQTLKLIKQLRKEKDEYSKKVLKWNQNYYWHDFDTFLDYILFDKNPNGYKTKKSLRHKLRNGLRI
ncbi:MAG: YkgJ family cysteine cluster protein [Candidatus Nanoarchaeia archaeon]|nr:YkgJ family cysteine cluster protein [Candidatus Nanoarchaeia archaeon]